MSCGWVHVQIFVLLCVVTQDIVWDKIYSFFVCFYVFNSHPGVHTDVSMCMIQSVSACASLFVWPGNYLVIHHCLSGWGKTPSIFHACHSQGWHSRCLYDLMLLSAGFWGSVHTALSVFFSACMCQSRWLMFTCRCSTLCSVKRPQWIRFACGRQINMGLVIIFSFLQ